MIPLQKFIKFGKLDLEGESTVLGIELARKLGVSVGDKVTIYSPGNLGQVLDSIKKLENAKGDEEKKAIDELRDVILPKELTVTGIFETGHYLHDSEFLLVPVYIGQELYGLGDALHGITVKTDNPYGAERVKEEIEQFLEPPEFAQTWIDMNRQYFEAVRLERTVMFFLLFFIVDCRGVWDHEHADYRDGAKAARDRNRESARGEYRANHLGLPGQGTIVGFFGTLTGLGLGMTLIRYRNEFSHWLASTLHIEIFPREVYQFSSIPAEVVPRRCRHHLHQRLFDLFVGCADPCVLRRAARTGQSFALRVSLATALLSFVHAGANGERHDPVRKLSRARNTYLYPSGHSLWRGPAMLRIVDLLCGQNRRSRSRRLRARLLRIDNLCGRFSQRRSELFA